MSADGKGEHRLTPREGDAPEGESVSSADRSRLVSRRDEDRLRQRPHRGAARLRDERGRHGDEGAHVGRKDERHAPDVVPDGASIAFARDGDIYVMGADGSDPKRISDINAQESDPAWSPDGDWIAYIRRTPGTPVQNLWVMHPDGTGRRALTKQAGRAFTPSWSPDSSRIVF